MGDTILRLPSGVFAPYTSITTNVLFFDNNKTGTKETWFYRVDLLKGVKTFSKTRPMPKNFFDPCKEWWTNREEVINDDGSENWKVKKYSIEELESDSYNLDKCGYI
jgi:type I restriction enzyme M protein